MIARAAVLEGRSETPTTHVLRIERPEGFEFEPVQYVGLEFETDEGPVEYPMSLASPPTKPYLEFGARTASGSAWKRAFAALEPGDEVEIDGPYGHFVLDETRPAVFLAGGIGITPLRGMMQHIADTGSGQAGRLLYSNRTPEEIAFRAELDGLAADHANLEVAHTITRLDEAAEPWEGRTGRIDGPMIEELAAGLEAPVYYVCGLPGMVRDLKRVLVAGGVPGEDVVSEGFWGYE